MAKNRKRKSRLGSYERTLESSQHIASNTSSQNTPSTQSKKDSRRYKNSAPSNTQHYSSSERSTVFHPEFREDLLHWVCEDKRAAKKILKLVEAINRDPFEGEGKPEPLKHIGSDVWSRRITQEHRLVYTVKGSVINLIQARYHY